MALNGTANPNCANVSNPYHQCTQACAQKTKQHGTKPQANNKKSNSRDGYGGVVRSGGELGRKRTQGCPKSSNPYHNCDQNCNNNNTLPNSGVDSNFNKQKRGSKPKPPVLTVPSSKAAAVPPLPINSKVEEEEKPKSDHNKDHDQHLITTTKPIENENKVADELPAADGSRGFSFSGSNSNILDCEKEETESVISESRIPVGKYNIKESFASTLQSILDKYGDIGESCHLESVAMRSYYIECVCYLVQQLQSDYSLMQLTNSKINELLAILKDVESANLRVAWLRIAVDEIAENIEVIADHQNVEAERANSVREMELLREQLDSELETLALKEQEVADIKNRIPDIRDRLSELQLKSSELDQTSVSIKSKVDSLNSKSSLDEL